MCTVVIVSRDQLLLDKATIIGCKCWLLVVQHSASLSIISRRQRGYHFGLMSRWNPSFDCWVLSIYSILHPPGRELGLLLIREGRFQICWWCVGLLGGQEYSCSLFHLYRRYCSILRNMSPIFSFKFVLVRHSSIRLSLGRIFCRSRNYCRFH